MIDACINASSLRFCNHLAYDNEFGVFLLELRACPGIAEGYRESGRFLDCATLATCAVCLCFDSAAELGFADCRGTLCARTSHALGVSWLECGRGLAASRKTSGSPSGKFGQRMIQTYPNLRFKFCFQQPSTPRSRLFRIRRTKAKAARTLRMVLRARAKATAMQRQGHATTVATQVAW